MAVTELIKRILTSDSEKETCVRGWVRTKRDSKQFTFVELNDGSCLSNLQVIIDASTPDYDALKEVSTGAAIEVSGKLVNSPGKGQQWEVHASSFKVFGLAPKDYPLQKKGHSMEFLREIAHLRPRSNLFGAVFRLRSKIAYSIHKFYNERDFTYVHTPIITASDCEGAGELFKVSTLSFEQAPKNKDESINYDKDFFAKPTFLTVSGQLEGEAFATALSKIYTFGPTFRAENSNTPRHAAEFWMIEPEMAFYDIHDNMDLAEEFVKYVIQDIVENCQEDLAIFSKFIDKGLMDRLNFVLENSFERLPYEKAIEVLNSSKKKFEYPVHWGIDLQTEHERYLTEEHFKKPVIVYNYPKEIKPFYMRKNDDGKTVAAMDVLVPVVGELIGGSQREERLEILQENLKQHQLPESEYWWYLDTRKFGTVPHSGFGLGFERLIMFITGMQNIRDVIPFARTPRNAEF